MPFKSKFPSWTFLSNHTHVLFCLHRNPDMTLREVSARVGITERAAQKLVKEMVEVNVLQVERIGRRNRYTINLLAPLRHPEESFQSVGHLLNALLPSS